MYSCVIVLSLCLVFPLVIFGQDVVLDPSGLVLLQQDESLTLTCTTTLTGDFNFIFTVDDQTVQNSTSDSLNITYTDETSLSDRGVYICSIDDGDGVPTMSQTSIRVLFAPIVTINPVDVSADNEGSISFNCGAVGFPTPKITWYRLMDGEALNLSLTLNDISEITINLPGNSNVTFENTEISINSTLAIDPVDFIDFGDYFCVASLDVDAINSFVASIIDGSGSSGSGADAMTTFDGSLFALSEIGSLTVSPLRSVVAAPGDQTVSYNGTATFNCTAEGGPNNAFYWVRGMPSFESDIISSSDFDSLDVVGTDPELTLSMSIGETGGEYTCVVFNDAGYDNDTVTLYVSPEILTQPEDQFVQDGDNVTLTCIADSFPAPEYEWEKLNMYSGEFYTIPDETSSTLVFDPIEHSDYGTYRCVVTTPTIDEQVISYNATITVSPDNSVAIDPFPYITIDNGDDVTFNCTAEGGPNNMFSWVRTQDIANVDVNIVAEDNLMPIDINGVFELLSEFIIVNDSMLSLASVNGLSDGGQYTCLVFNEAGVGREETTLYVRPVITQQPMDVNAENGTRVELTCMGDSFPAPQYQWEMINNTDIFSPIYSETDPTLVFDPVNFDDFGTYRCVVTTPIINEQAISNEAILTISPNNSVRVMPSSVTVDNGSSVTFYCFGEGSNDNVFTWLRSEDVGTVESNLGGLLTQQPLDVNAILSEISDYIVFNGSNLTIDSVNATRDGGSYSCVVLNVAGFDLDAGNLFVNPVITISPENVETNVNNTVSLSCFADSFFPPEYQWLFMNRATQMFEPIEGENSTELLFESIEFEEYGMYQCYVTAEVFDNDNGGIILANVTSDPALITVSPNGSIMVDPQQMTADRNTDVTFNCNARGGPNNTFYWVNGGLSSVDTSDLPNSLYNVLAFDNDTLTLDNVIGSSGGDYTCVVFNDAGFDIASVTLYISPEILLEPMNVYTDDNELVMLTCEADSFPPPEYQWQMMEAQFDDLVGEINSTLVFDPVDFSDFGTYRCVVTTPIINETVMSAGAIITVSPFGSILATPSYQISSRGSTPSFNCSALGGPMNMFNWIKGDQVTYELYNSMAFPLNVSEIFASQSNNVSSSNELSIIIGTEQTSAQMIGGDYSCIVINEAGLDNATVTLYISPEIVQDPVDQFVQDGDTVTLTCIGDSFPPPTYQWERRNMSTDSFEPIPEETNSDLVFVSIEHEDYGDYRCVVTTPTINEYVMSDIALITVSPNNSVAIYPSPSFTVDNGSSILFTCMAEGGPNNTFTWVRTDDITNIITDIGANDSTMPIDVTGFFELLSGYIITNDSLLTIDLINGTLDGGDYTCLVINEAGVGREETTLYVRPVITQQPMDVNAENGDRVELTCMGDSFPAPQYQWEMMNRMTEMFEVLDDETSTSLVISSIVFEQYGTYRCRVTTPTIDVDVTSDNVTITVSPLGSVMIDPQIINSTNEEMVTLTCSARGGPDNYFVWTYLRTGEEVPATTEDMYTSEYTFTSSISTGGDYQCTVSNGAGNDTDIATVNVGPFITVNPISINVTIIDENITLTCVAMGVPRPFITWTHNGTLLNEDGALGDFENGIDIDSVEDILGTIESTLTIDSALANHTGEYFCTATSPVEDYDSVMSTIALVLVQDVPEPPVNLTAEEINSRSVNLTWVEPADNNAPITQYEVFYTTPSFLGAIDLSQRTDDETEIIVISDLHPGEYYTFTVRAINEEGSSEESVPLTIRTDEEEPAGFPQNLTAITINSTAITVSWDKVLVNETNGIITQYNIIGVPDASFSVPTVEETVDNSTFSIQFNNLEEFVIYSFTISARTLIGFGPESPEESTRTDEAEPASPPLNFTVTNFTANSISLEWEPPLAEDINGIIRNYTIKYNIIEQLGVADNDLDMTVVDVNVPGNITLDRVLDNLDNYTVYNISIVAVTIGEGPSTELVQRTDENAPEAPPVSVTATTNSTTSIIVRWNPPSLDMTNGIIDSYEIRYGRYNDNTDDIFSDIVTQPIFGNETFEFEVRNLQEFIEYGFQVRAITVAAGPYSDFATNITEQAAPMVPPTLPANPVPEEDITPTSVRLVWIAIPPNDANGALTYNVTISVTGMSVDSRKKRETETNTLSQCLAAAGIDPVFSDSVPGDQTNLTLNNIAPNTNYEFIVAGVTDAGTGPATEPVAFATVEGVPTAPRDVQLMNTSSTSLMLEWDQPICDNGIRTRYMITYTPLPVPDSSDGVIGDQPMIQDSISVNAVNQMFSGLTPNSPYEIIICAFTATGCGVNVTINQTTTEDAPLPVTQLTLDNETTISDIIISWSSPSNRNGSFNIFLTYTAVQVFIYNNRIQRDSKELNLLGSETMSAETEMLPEVLPYAQYTVTLTAFNRLFGMTLAREPVTVSIISQPIASTAVVNMSAVAITASEILVQWDAPLYPNGPITYFTVCINVSICFNALPNDTSYTLVDLTTLTTNDITVQPFTVFEGNMLVGVISNVQTVFINTTSLVTGPTDINDRTTGTIRVTLPTYTSFGGDVIFYGVIVTDRSDCESVTNFGADYPNPQPRSDSNTDDYYIAAGWSDTSLIPVQFTAGDGDTTTATLLDQVETFTNPRLDNFKRYCVIAFVHQDSGVINQPITRYVNLASAETRLGYSREALGFFMALLVILIIAGVVAVILFILYRRYKTEFYSVIHKDKNSHPLESVKDSNGTSLVIMNKPVEDEETRFVDPSSSKRPISVTDFPAHVSNMHSNDDYLFSVEYPTVEPRHGPTTDATHHPDNAIKNRYANITAYDHSRVRLQEIPNVPGSDYINASFIDGYKAPNTYIASQGPVPGSVIDFWRMVWEQGSATIVMLTNLEEKGRVKCSMYWPPPNKRVQVHGTIRVQLQEELYLSDHTIRTFSLQKERGDERIVKQFHYTAWPDFGVPEHPTPLLRFIRKVETGNPVNAGPMIVHCSAGVGRTGTFVTISTQIKRLKDVQTVDIFNFVQSMRYRRCFMVQTEAQYIFTHDAILEVIECGETEVSARELKDRFHKLSTFNDTEGLMNIEIEYERIQDTIHTEPVRYAGALQFNRQKNRFHNVIPFDKSRCRLSAVPGVDGSDYVNANFVEGYHKGKAFVATQGPLPDTAEDFWRMVWEYKSSTIVMLAKEREGPKVMCHRYWPDETTGSEMHGPFEISLHSVREYPDYVLRELKIVDTRDLEGSSQHLKQYHYTGWPTEGVPTSAIGLLDIREQVEKWQRNSGDKPIIVHCSGGCGRTGSFIAMCLLIDRLKTEGVVDIFQTVRGLRLQRPGMVRSVEQYDFIYKGILEYLGSFDNYANFSL